MSRQRVGVVGDLDFRNAVEAAGGAPIVERDAIPDASFVVAVGDAAVVDLARSGVATPVLPIEAGNGLRSVPRSEGVAAIERVVGGAYSTETHPVLSIETPERTIRALLDALFVAAEPARISEYGVHWCGERVAEFRADGVVVSTPAGSVGYNDAADGPLVAPETDAVSIVPVAPFATDPNRWVVPIESLTVTVERDETPVELVVDGRRETELSAGVPVRFGCADAIETIVVPESRAFF